MIQKTDGHYRINLLQNNTKPMNTRMRGRVLSRFQRVKTEFFSVRGSRTVTINLSILYISRYVMRCAIWYHLYNLKNVKNTHGGVLLLVKLQVSAWNFTKINTLPWVFFTFFKLCTWYQIVQSIIYIKMYTL